MEMHQIRYFLAVAEHLNFTRAANACNVSQPSLTRAIKMLEEELGGPLFHRERANTHLSELGRIVAPHLALVFDQSCAAKRAARDAVRLNKTELRLGLMCTIAPSELVDLLIGVQAHHGGVAVSIVDRMAKDVERLLLEGEVDAAIYCAPGEKPDARIHALPLFREQMMIVLPMGHPLATQPSVRVADLDGLPYLNRSSCEFNGYADRFFDEKGVDCPTVYSSERDDWIIALVRAGAGFAFLPASLAHHPAVVARPLVEPEFWRAVNLCTVRRRAAARSDAPAMARGGGAGGFSASRPPPRGRRYGRLTPPAR
jgi:DNA-binding transcriptional LysR family regulator